MPKYRMADLIVEYAPVYSRLAAQSEKYRLPEAEAEGISPDIHIALTEEFLDRQTRNYPDNTRNDLEYFFVGQRFYLELLRFGGCMVHASAVEMDGYAYLFTAPSGTGKSTHTSQWRKLFGDRAVILNDDKPAVRKKNGVWQAFGTPFSGSTALNENRAAPVGGLCLLERGEENRIHPIDPKEAVVFFLSQSQRSTRREEMEALLQVMNAFLTAVPVYRMQCTISTEAAQVAFDGMRPDK